MPENKASSLQAFEQSLEQLEEIVRKMEQGQLTLEQSLGAFEEGVKLTRECQTTLKQAEQRVSQLRIDGDTLNGDDTETPPA